MEENFFESLKGQRKIDSKKEMKESAVKEPEVRGGREYEEYLKNQDCYEDACRKKEQKEQEFFAVKNKREQIVRELQDCHEQKNRLAQEYQNKKEEAPENTRERWEQIREQELADIEYQKQAACEQAESKKQICDQDEAAALAEMKRTLW